MDLSNKIERQKRQKEATSQSTANKQETSEPARTQNK